MSVDVSKLQTTLKSCDYFFWKDDEMPKGYYKNLIRTLKQQVESKENFAELVNLRKKVVDLEFLLSKEKLVVENLEKKVTKEKEAMMMLNKKPYASMQQNCMCESSGCDTFIGCCTLVL
ncbi:unnamed protein product [Lactuca saligna]|uniref:Uncharacterized protein n=1 Tax=Lactuca saligna TaxID=75948 RepID=A0AA35VHZ1_LACSI|nr:unnamed protein product [Lactuca saligna]